MIFSKRQHAFTAWLLTASILLYPLFSYLATPTVKTTASGQLLVICTLNGLKQVYVNLTGSAAAETQHDQFCPALELVKLAGSIWQPALPQSPVIVFYQTGLLEKAAAPEYRARYSSAYSPRAPPPQVHIA